MEQTAGGYDPLLDPEAQDMSLLKNAEQSIRAGFVRKVYSILSVQLLVTAIIAAPIVHMGRQFVQVHAPLIMLSSMMLVATMCVMMCAQDMIRKFPNNYIMLSVFTVCEGISIGAFCTAYTWQSVMLAAGVTGMVFLAMTAYAITTKTDFTGFGPYLVAAMFCLMGMSLVIMVMMMFGVAVNLLLMLYDLCGVMLFTMFIVYDTQLIVGGNHQASFSVDDYAFAALNLYLDIINLFINVMELLGTRE